MKNPVMIKGNKYGITLVLEKELEFDTLLELISEKFIESNKFFDAKQQVAISFEGRNLSNEEQSDILTKISENTKLNISYIIDDNTATKVKFKEAIDQLEAQETVPEPAEQSEPSVPDDGQFYKGTLRSGQSLDANSSIVVVGDVNPGASVVSKGNIIILGCLKGTAYAGCDGNDKAFVVALEMNPMQIRIGNIIARAPDKKKKKVSARRKSIRKDNDAKIAFVENENIYIEEITKTLLNDISISY